MSIDSDVREHPDAEDMAAYLDGQVAEADRARFEEHIVSCPECRREIAEVSAFLTRTRRRRGWRVWAPAAVAAAAVAMLVVGPVLVDTGPADGARFRGPDPVGEAGAVQIDAASPAEDGAVDSHSLTFAWHPGALAASYRLTLTDREGAVLWTHATTDTVAPLPDTITLEPGATYHWFVDALMEDGRNATSGVHSFMTR